VSPGVVRGAVSFVLAFALAGCGSQHYAGNSRPGAGASAPSGAFTVRARQVVAQWNGSPAARAWRTGLVLLSRADLTSTPANVGFASQRQKDAFASGRFRLVGALPGQALHGRIRWADGSTLAVPLLGARATFRQLATGQACGGPPCGQLTVTAARPAAVTAYTSRGPAVIPGWQFTVAELGWPVTEAAVVSGTVIALPDRFPQPTTGQDISAIGGLRAVSADGRTLTLQFATGACVTAWGAHVYQAATAVVVGSWASGDSAGTCPEMAVLRSAHVTLLRPLGSRVVLDVASGEPIVPGAPPRW
jgi:hypothetical protein